ncbi:MAG: Zn-ribbon domain-containing protein [Candidatus Aenigmatarchaeota archaeon]
MPHECLNCGKVIDDDSDELMDGCNNCGYKLFMYKSDKKKRMDKDEREAVVQDVEEFIDNIEKKEEFKQRIKQATEFDLESISIVEDGVYEINLKKLFEEVPLIIEIRDGKYFIHLPSLFTKGKEKSISLEDLKD